MVHFDQIYDDEKWKFSNHFSKNQSSMACIQWDILPAKLLISKIAFLIMLKEISLLKPFSNFSFFSQQMAIFFSLFREKWKGQKIAKYSHNYTNQEEFSAIFSSPFNQVENKSINVAVANSQGFYEFGK